ncbi:MAG: small basic family protein [Clostridia bacterium]|nr:small basic family protein [Clostridia bacterium]
MIAITGLLVGIALAFCINFHIPATHTVYVAVGILAALDSVFGGLAASMQKKFNIVIFITGFFSNVLLAAGLTYFGKMLGLDLYMAAIIVFGTRLFQNFAIIRRLLLIKLEKRDKIYVSENSEED